MAYIQTLSAKRPGTNDHLGDKNTLTYNTIIVGGTGYPGSTYDGAIFIFDRVGATSYYSYTSAVSATKGSGIYFGFSQAINTNYIYASGPRYNADRGIVYEYNNSGNRFKLNSSIIPTTRGLYGLFGSALILDGANLIIGAPQAETLNAGAKRGAVHIYNRSSGTWTRAASLSTTDSSNLDRFGWTFSGDSSEVLVGAPNYNSEQGRVYQFYPNPADPNTWSNTQIISLNGSGGLNGPWSGQIASGVNPGSQFGLSIDKGNNYMVIGAPFLYLNSTKAFTGAAFLYQRVGLNWTYVSILTADITSSDNFFAIEFGYSVALNELNNTVLVGANAINSGNGKVFGFDISNPNSPKQTFVIDRPTPVANANFGKDIKLLPSQENGIALIGNDGALVDPDNGSVFPPQCGGALLFNQVNLISPTPTPTLTPTPAPSPTPEPTRVPKAPNWYGLASSDPISFGEGAGPTGVNYPKIPSRGGIGRNYSILKELGYYGVINSVNSSLRDLAILYGQWCVNNRLNPAAPHAMSEFYDSRGISLGFNYKVIRKLVSGGKYCTNNDGIIWVNIGPVTNDTTPTNGVYANSGFIGNPLRDSTYTLSVVGCSTNVQATITKSSASKFIQATGLRAEQAYWFTSPCPAYTWTITDEFTGHSVSGSTQVGGACNNGASVIQYQDYKQNFPRNT
jgi:hypothetical protein